MIVYKYNEEGYYIGPPHDCQRCPKTGGWLYPPRYLTTEPGEQEKYKCAKADGDKWISVDDNRNREIWNIQTGRREICEHFDIPENYTTVKPPDEMYHTYFNGSWVVDKKKKSEYDEQKKVVEDEALISAEIRKIAISNLGSKLKVVKK